MLKIDAEKLWIPDIELYNNADPNRIGMRSKTNALVYSDGEVLWVPPVQVKSYCALSFKYWPFDQQTCTLKFGSWTHDGFKISLSLYNNKDYIDLSDYEWKGRNEWKILEVPAKLNTKTYSCCPEPYQDITFNLTV